ncbi:hypothetical protein pEaSNUABM37_00098 [Erwinia phage pEa_SNUABM_37]|nr:hypothetical protein pEaSNUABM37_00098 [Erwinia phage pEa_SNUABM_37]QXO10568.1 hypothetical protein pEaSNUABM48_00098 [Erwinia phage pEa_SNUABM_48]
MTIKTMAELNKAEPHLRDLEITVDGLNVVDIQFAGPGVWVPRFTVQISGDQGINEVTKGRMVYLSAAEYLRSALLNNGTGDGTKPHAFVPHANISREDEPGDQDAAVAVANRAITRLLDVYNGTDPENDGKPVEDDFFEWYGKSLHIVVRTVDFDLTEKRILSGEAFEHLQAIIGTPASPSPALTSLLTGTVPHRSNFNIELTPTDATKEFDGVMHVSLTHKATEGSATVLYWVPISKADQFTSLANVINGVQLLPVANGNGYVEYLVRDLNPTALEVIPLDIRNTTVVENGGVSLDVEEGLTVSNVTKSFDGVLHASVVLEGNLTAPNQVFWIPADRIDEFPSLEAIRSGTVLTCIANGNDWIEYLVQIPSIETAVPEIKPDVRNLTTLIDGIPHKRFERHDNDTTNVFWVPETMELVIDQTHDVPDDLVMTIIADNGDNHVEWLVISRK